jgi:hypothetical protein
LLKLKIIKIYFTIWPILKNVFFIVILCFQVFRLPSLLQYHMTAIFMLLLMLNITEMLCYVILFCHIYNHDNTVGALVLRPDVIKMRNSRNAISLLGQLSTWLLETSYNLLMLYFIYLYRFDVNQELASIFKLSEFTLIPLAQVLCSPPLRNFLFRKD